MDDAEILALFDASRFESAHERKARARRAKRDVQLDPVEDPWALVATRRGIDEYQHVIKAHLTLGSIVTECGLKGRKFNCLPGDEHTMVATKCPTCNRALDER